MIITEEVAKTILTTPITELRALCKNHFFDLELKKDFTGTPDYTLSLSQVFENMTMDDLYHYITIKSTINSSGDVTFFVFWDSETDAFVGQITGDCVLNNEQFEDVSAMCSQTNMLVNELNQLR